MFFSLSFGFAPFLYLFDRRCLQSQFVLFVESAQVIEELSGREFAQRVDRQITHLLDHRDPLLGNTDGRLGLYGITYGFLFGTHLREEEDILDRGLAGHEHRQSVDADTHTRAGRHTVFEGADKIHVDEHRLVIAFLRETQLLLETLQLIDRVVQLRVGVAQLLAVYEELETLGEIGV